MPPAAKGAAYLLAAAMLIAIAPTVFVPMPIEALVSAGCSAFEPPTVSRV